MNHEDFIRTALRDLFEFDLIYIDPARLEVLTMALDARGIHYLTTDRGGMAVISLVSTRGKAARRA